MTNAKLTTILDNFDFRKDYDWDDWVVYETQGARPNTVVTIHHHVDDDALSITVQNIDDDDTFPESLTVTLSRFDENVLCAVLTQLTFVGQEGG